MKKKSSAATENELLNLLKRVLPKATHDAALAGKILAAVEAELSANARANAFEQFCEKVELPDLDAKTILDVKKQFASTFPDADIAIKPNKADQSAVVEVAMKNGRQFTSEIKVRPVSEEESGEQEVVFKFVPFPVALPTDPELVWVLGKRETMSNEEAGIVLTKLEEEFWATKAGQKLQRDRVEKCFAEFVARVPAGMLSEVGLKRHYKTPEVLKELHPIAPAKKKAA